MKKILSILLSAILAVSVFAISASARVIGDVNSDKSANSADALKILMYSVGTTTDINTTYADVNCDGKVNSADALTVLNIAVGNYSGPTSGDFKPEVIDPIVKTKKFTLSTVVIMDGEEVPSTIMINGNDVCMAMTVQGINARMLLLDGKMYMVFPDLHVYCEMSEADTGSLDLSDVSFDSNQTYAGSRYVTENGKTYTVDSYKNPDGSISDYYFLNGKWAKLVDDAGTADEAAQEITEFKSGVTSSYFSLFGMIKVDVSALSQ